MSILSELRSKRDEFAEAAIPIVIACFPLIWLAPIHRHFFHAVSDWDNNLWMIGYCGEYFRQHLSFPMTFNTDPLVGMPNPLFYGSLFYPFAGILSAFLGSALALRLIVVVLLWLQTTQVFRTVKLFYQDSYVAWSIAAVVAFAIYPLSNLYTRGAISEFVAVSLLTSACCVWLRAMVEGPQERSWTSASWACLLLALSAGTHPITALFGGLLFGILVLPGLLGAPDAVRRIKFMVLYTLLYLAALSPWLYIMMKYYAPLSRSMTAPQGTIVFGDSIDLWWVRLLPIPFDIRPLWTPRVSDVSTPYLDAPINFGLLLMVGYLGFQVYRRRSACLHENSRAFKAAALCLGALIGTFTLSVSTHAWRLVPRFLEIVQFAYRLVSYCDLLLYILVILLLIILNKYRTEFVNGFKVCLALALVLMAQSVLVKFDHASYIQENKVVPGTSPFGDRAALKSLPGSFYFPKAYVIQSGYAGMAPPLPLVRFLPAVGERFGEVPAIELNGLKYFVTNVLAFPWNRLVVNGRTLSTGEMYISEDNTLAYGNTALGVTKVGYAFIPERGYLFLRYVSAVVLAAWIGVLAVTAFWRRRFTILSAKTVFSGLLFFLIAAIGNALPLLSPHRPLAPPAAGAAAPQMALGKPGDLSATSQVSVPALVIKMQIQFTRAGRNIAEPRAEGNPLEEPLVVTGQAGAADMVGVLYDADGSLRIQIDHWGAAPSASLPIKIRPGQMCWVRMVFGSTGVSVSLDGDEVVRSDVPAFPTTLQQITVAQNNFVGATKAARFSGKVLQCQINRK